MTTISNTADHATEHVKEAASHVRTSMLDLSTQVIRFINGAREAQGRGMDSVLDRMGLQRRQSALGPILWFTVGAVAAGTAVLLMSPTTGKKLRQRIASFLGHAAEASAAPNGAVEPRVETEASPGRNGANYADHSSA
jgi:hypothetical protein